MSRGEYLVIKWTDAFEERIDFYTTHCVFNNARAHYDPSLNILRLYVDNIWYDTRNFDDFVDGLNMVFITELLCHKYHFDKKKHILKLTELLCIKTMKKGNHCPFLCAARKAHNSNYRIKPKKAFYL